MLELSSWLFLAELTAPPSGNDAVPHCDLEPSQVDLVPRPAVSSADSGCQQAQTLVQAPLFTAKAPQSALQGLEQFQRQSFAQGNVVDSSVVSNVVDSSAAPQLSTAALPLRRGSRGRSVEILQSYLQDQGHYTGPIDGVYGPMTQAAVRQFQQTAGLTVDGVFGPQSWQQLQQELASEIASQTASVSASAPASEENAVEREAPSTAVPSPSKPALPPSQPAQPETVTAQPSFSTAPAAEPFIAPAPPDPAVSADHGSVGRRMPLFDTRWWLWLAASGLISSGSVQAIRIYRHRQKLRLANTLPIHRPVPVYPNAVLSRVNQQEGELLSPSSTHAMAEAMLPTPLEMAASVSPEQDNLAVLTAEGDSDSSENAPQPAWDALAAELEHLSQAFPWAEESDSPYLEDFLYDLIEPDSRERFIQQHIVKQAHADAPAWVLPKAVPVETEAVKLCKKVGSFPAAEKQTGQPYEYALVDDMGGSFRMVGCELWVTEVARRLLEHSIPYILTIRRRDWKGSTAEKQYQISVAETLWAEGAA